jgi:hypothetical protein
MKYKYIGDEDYTPYHLASHYENKFIFISNNVMLWHEYSPSRTYISLYKNYINNAENGRIYIEAKDLFCVRGIHQTIPEEISIYLTFL